MFTRKEHLTIDGAQSFCEQFHVTLGNQQLMLEQKAAEQHFINVRQSRTEHREKEKKPRVKINLLFKRILVIRDKWDFLLQRVRAHTAKDNLSSQSQLFTELRHYNEGSNFACPRSLGSSYSTVTTRDGNYFRQYCWSPVIEEVKTTEALQVVTSPISNQISSFKEERSRTNQV